MKKGFTPGKLYDLTTGPPSQYSKYLLATGKQKPVNKYCPHCRENTRQTSRETNHRNGARTEVFTCHKCHIVSIPYRTR